MSSVITTAREFRAEVLRGDKAMLRQLDAAYSLIAKRLEREFRELMRDIERAQREGRTVNRDWLRRSFRYQQLIRQAKAEISGFARGATPFIESKQRQAIRLGQSHATSLIEAALPEITFARLPTEAIEEMAGVLANGSPLNKTLEKLGPELASEIRQKLIEGLGAGKSPRVIARELSSAVDIPRWRALQIARNESLRAYRSANLQTLAENSDVVSGWYWWASLTSRTCFVCWGLHGKFFPVTKTFFANHVSCRCTTVPAIKGSDYRPIVGARAFANLKDDQQSEILGPSRLEMYRTGTPLEAFTMLTRDPEWGPSYAARPLYQLKKKKAA